MAVKQTNLGETVSRIFEALGGEAREWHPRTHVGEDGGTRWDILEESPTDIREEWGRPNLEEVSSEIGAAGELHLQESYNMERMNGSGGYQSENLDFNPNAADEVDLVVTEGPFKDALVQSKGAALKTIRGTKDYSDEYKTTPGGIYMQGANMEALKERDQDALLHTWVHYPRTEEMFGKDCPVPVLEVTKEEDKLGDDRLETAVVGELVLPVDEVIEQVEFYPSNYRLWEWPDAYGEEPDSEEIADNWYSNIEF